MAKKQNQTVIDTAKELFALLGINDSFEVLEKDDGFEVVIETEESGIIIGHHGENLEGLQLVLSLCVSKKLGEFKRVSVEVGDYKKNREEWLRNLATQTKERAIAENKEVYLSNLKSWERRIVHLFLQEDDEVVSESVGEGKDRVMVVKPKTS